MRIEIIIDPADHRDVALRTEIDLWLQCTARDQWTVTETDIEADDDADGTGRTRLAYSFRDVMDADDLYHHLAPLARRRF